MSVYFCSMCWGTGEVLDDLPSLVRGVPDECAICNGWGHFRDDDELPTTGPCDLAACIACHPEPMEPTA